MKKIVCFFSIILLLIIITVFIYIKSHIFTINKPIEVFSLEGVSIEKSYSNLTEILEEKDMLTGYELSSMECYPNKKIGYVVYSNTIDKSVIFVQIDKDIFTTAVRYDSNCKESKRLWGYPIPFDLVKIYSQDLNKIIKDKDADFSSNSIKYILLENNAARNKIIWRCIYKSNNYKDLEIDAVSGEVLRVMENE